MSEDWVVPAQATTGSFVESRLSPPSENGYSHDCIIYLDHGIGDLFAHRGRAASLGKPSDLNKRHFICFDIRKKKETKETKETKEKKEEKEEKEEEKEDNCNLLKVSQDRVIVVIVMIIPKNNGHNHPLM